MRIAVIGTACQGKTTYISDFLKRWPMYKTPQKTYRDLIKEKNLALNENGTEESQKIILDFLVDQAIEFSKEKFYITDRCPLDNLAYTSWLNLKGKASDRFLDETRIAVRESLRFFDILFFFPLTKVHEIPIEEDGLRSVNPQYREEIDNIFKVFQISYQQNDGRIFPLGDSPALIELFGDRETRISLTELYINNDGNPFGETEKPLIEMPWS